MARKPSTFKYDRPHRPPAITLTNGVGLWIHPEIATNFPAMIDRQGAAIEVNAADARTMSEWFKKYADWKEEVEVILKHRAQKQAEQSRDDA